MATTATPKDSLFADHKATAWPTQPNVANVSQTGLPLIATVLAGFSVTVVAQVPALASAEGASKAAMLRAGTWLIVLPLSLAAVVLIFSTILAITSQAYNFQFVLSLPSEIGEFFSGKTVYNAGTTALSEDFRKLLKFWRRRQEYWHLAALLAFYLGGVLFLFGAGSFLFVFVDPTAQLLAVVAYVACVVLCVVVGLILLGRQPSDP